MTFIFEVLDLSFNRLADTSQFQQLGCLGHLRSLQLNDNPVSERADYMERILQAVPWLAELDNEVVLENSKHKALQSILQHVMHVIGSEYLKQKSFTGQIPFLGLADPKNMPSVDAGLHMDKSQLVLSPENTCVPRISAHLTDIMNGGCDQAVLWGALSSIAHDFTGKMNMAFLGHKHNIEYGLQVSSLPSHLDAEWKFHAFQLMCSSHKERLLYTTKEKNFGKTNHEFEASPQLHPQEDLQQSIEEFSVDVPSCNQSELKPKEANKTVDDLRFCFHEVVNFDHCKYKELYLVSSEYKMEMKVQKERVIKVQALLRGFLARLCFRKAKLEKRKSELLIRKVQACWKGWRCRNCQVLECLKQESQSKKIASQSATKIQAYWRGYKERILFHEKKLIVSKVIKIQACWRGHCTRLLFHRAFSNIKYTDDDDFDYVAIDNNEIVFNEIDLDIDIQGDTFIDPFFPNIVNSSIFPICDGIESEEGNQSEKGEWETDISLRNEAYQVYCNQANHRQLETKISPRIEEYQVFNLVKVVISLLIILLNSSPLSP
eukprot:Gb_31752 [translate_table: standard]